MRQVRQSQLQSRQAPRRQRILPERRSPWRLLRRRVPGARAMRTKAQPMELRSQPLWKCAPYELLLSLELVLSQFRLRLAPSQNALHNGRPVQRNESLPPGTPLRSRAPARFVNTLLLPRSVPRGYARSPVVGYNAVDA